MPVRRALLSAVLLAVACALTACGSDAPEPQRPARAKPLVMTTFYPTTWMVERVAGDLVELRCPLPEDADPIFWQPDDATLTAYQQADLIVVNGAQFEKWVATASLPSSRVLDTSKSFADRFIAFEGAIKHSHGAGGAHVHEGLDGHTWLDPVNAKEQMMAIYRALQKLLPGHYPDLFEGARSVEGLLASFDAGLKMLGKLPEGRWLYASHPAYNYLAQRYGWPMVNLDLDPEEMPKDAVFADVKQRLAAQPGSHLLWESAPTPEIAERFEKETGLKSLVVEPCETTSAADRASGRDYEARWKQNLIVLRQAFPAR
jgi:zinc transport system substrate-binding protein